MRKPKLGGQKQLRIFLKGNDDVVNSLLPAENGDARRTPGLPALLREKYGGAFEVELIHEPGERSDIFLQQLRGAPLPAEIARPDAGGQMHSLAAQFRTRLRERSVDIVVLGLQAEVEAPAWMHRTEGYRIGPPPGWQQEGDAQRKRWLAEAFSPIGQIPVSESKENFTRIIQTIKEELDAHVLVFNCSSIDPEDHIDNYCGREDNRELRTHKLNLALMQLSALEGISIIDVDRLIAELGGQQHVRQWCRYSPEAYAAIGQEFVRVLEDIGFFENRPLVMQMGQRGRMQCSSSS